jgi:NAD(P)-dependent dehydrogenase (short-subunit alcohol dehydrogenase family)
VPIGPDGGPVARGTVGAMDQTRLLPAGLGIFDLTGKIALVTGGGRGLGRAMARALAGAGADVAVAGRTESDLETVVAELRELGRNAVALVADVSDAGSATAMVEAVVEHFGRIDIVVNNAGISHSVPALDLELDDWDRLMALNLRGSFVVARAAGRHMVEQGYGRIINITSILASVAFKNQTVYAATKGGLTQMAKVLAVEWAPHGVTVNCIGPTFFETEYTRPRYTDPDRVEFIRSRTPMARWGQPDELAGAVVFLASDAAAFVTGHTLFVDGGFLIW